MLQEKPKTIPLSDKELESLGIDENVNDLRLARSFVKENSEDTGDCIVYYFAPPKLPDTKTVILSATFNSEVYRKYFETEIIEYPVIMAPYCGKIKQFTYHSLGRRNLKEKEE